MKVFRDFDVKLFIFQRFRANYLVKDYGGTPGINLLYALLSCLLYPVKMIFSQFSQSRAINYKIAGCPYASISVIKTLNDIFAEKYGQITVGYEASVAGNFFPTKTTTSYKPLFLPTKENGNAFYMDIISTTKIVTIQITQSLRNNLNDYLYFLKVVNALIIYGVQYQIEVKENGN